MPDRFIISTGRSGSTLLSRMVAENRNVLVLSEFLSGIESVGLPAGDVSGEQFSNILHYDAGLSALIELAGGGVEENLDPGAGPGKPASPVTGLPPGVFRTPCQTISDDPAKVYADMVAFAARQPTRGIGDQLRALFDWLTEKSGKAAWVERSGFGIRLFPELRRAIPGGRFLHIHRDGLETALSMYNHGWFRVGAYFDLFPPTVSELEHAYHAPADGIVQRLRQNPAPIEIYGEHWSNSICRAYRDLAYVPPENYAELRYEDLLNDVRRTLADLETFLELPKDPGWIDRAAALLKPERQVRAARLSDDERVRLIKACRPAQILLGRENPSHIDLTLERVQQVFRNVRAGHS